MNQTKRTVVGTVTNCIMIFAVLGALISLLSVLSKQHVIFDILSHFRIQYIALLIPAFFIAMYTRHARTVMVVCLALAVHGYSVTMSVLPIPVSLELRESSDYVELTVLNSNLLLVNSNYEEQLDFIDSVQPDIIGFQEYTDAWHEVLSTRLVDHPHSASMPLQNGFGIALYSKYPIVSGGVELLSAKSTHAINVRLNLGEKIVRVVTMHPPPPSSRKLYDIRNEQLVSLAQNIPTFGDEPLIVMGDFNATPWSSHLTDLQSNGQLRNARSGFGLHPTWPTYNVLLQIPIDHILVNSKVAVRHFDSEHMVGSDHKAIYSRLRVY